MIINLLKIAGGAAFAALLVPAAMAQGAHAQEGSYAAHAIASGQLGEAERILQPISLADANDPARLINLATVYARTGRYDAARTALDRVRTLPDEQLDLENGRSYSSHMLAAAMLGRLMGQR